jgi:uncharacterized DUF497 family protein
MYVWDETKNRKNQVKHGICFEEAQTVFEDPLALIWPNENGSEETREIIIGYSKKHRQLFVVFFEEAEGEDIRIISARKLTRPERKSLGRL